MAIQRAAYVIGLTALCGGVPFAAGMYRNGASLSDSLWAGGLTWLEVLGIAFVFLCIRWLGRATRSGSPPGPSARL